MKHRYQGTPEHAYRMMTENLGLEQDPDLFDQDPRAQDLADAMVKDIQDSIADVLKAAADEMDEAGFNDFRKDFFGKLKGAVASEVASAMDLNHRHLTSRAKGQF
jgi:hypothetical protein